MRKEKGIKRIERGNGSDEREWGELEAEIERGGWGERCYSEIGESVCLSSARVLTEEDEEREKWGKYFEIPIWIKSWNTFATCQKGKFWLVNVFWNSKLQLRVKNSVSEIWAKG